SAAYVSNNCDERKCEDISPFEDIGNIEFLPNKEQLSRICPNALRYIVCLLDNIKDCTGMGIAELTTSSNETLATESKLFLGIGSIFADLCDEDSSFHRDYVASVDCVSRFIEEGPGPNCKIGGGGSDNLETLDISHEDEELQCL
ncbi:uncharacterized protein NPIL_232601, partial [Nephila pilipes]